MTHSRDPITTWLCFKSQTFHYRKAGVGPSAKKHSPLWHHWLILLLWYLIQLCSFELWHSLQRPAAHRQPAASCTCPDFHFLFFQRCARQDESNSCLRSFGVYFFCQKLGAIPSWSESSSLADALVTPDSVSASQGFHYSRNSFPLANSFFPFQLSLTANHQSPSKPLHLLLLHTTNFVSSFTTSIKHVFVLHPGLLPASSPQSGFSPGTPSALCPSDVLDTDHKEKLNIC